MDMKKRILGLAAAAGLIFALVLAGCQGKKGQAQTDLSLTVGATAVPHAELLNLVREDLAGEGIALKVVEFSDYVQPNAALAAGDLDANFFQHLPYLESNAEWKSALVSAFGVHVEPLGVYSGSIKNIGDLKD
jgi:D-methionine transport system substrate-binding protein